MVLKLLKILFSLALLIAVAIGLISINHPIILKWVTGTARIIGKPIPAIVYTNEKINNEAKVFRVNKYWDKSNAEYYVLFFPGLDSRLNIIGLNKKENYAAVPVSTNTRNYDFLMGRLFQSETGAKFVPHIEGIKGVDFKPVFKDNELKVYIPPTNDFPWDSIRVIISKS